MCQAAINLTSKALNDVTDAEVLLKIKGFISLFIQTMEVGNLGLPSPSCFANALFRVGDILLPCWTVFS